MKVEFLLRQFLRTCKKILDLVSKQKATTKTGREMDTFVIKKKPKEKEDEEGETKSSVSSKKRPAEEETFFFF